MEVEDYDEYQAFRKAIEKWTEHNYVPGSSKERIQFLMEHFLYNKGYVKTDDLCDMLFVFRKTLAVYLKETKRRLEEFHLKLISKPNYGMRMEGREFDLRLCLANYIAQSERFHYGSNDDKSGRKDLQVIADCITACLREQEFEMSDLSLQNLIVHIYIAAQRVRERYYVPMEPGTLAAYYDKKEYLISEKIVQRISAELGVSFPDSETCYIALHIAGKKIINQFYEGTGNAKNLVISQKVSDLVTEMLQAVFEAFEFDFRDDLELQMSLAQHIVPLEVRIQNDMKMRNPLLKDIKKRYALAYAMASQACTVIKSHYQKGLTQDEVGYIALAFALALERRHTRIEKKNILLVCSSGKGSAQLLAYKIQREFSDYINQLMTCDVNSIYKIDFKKVDYIFTTVPIHITVPVPIKEVQYFLEDKDIREMKHLLTADGSCSILEYYDEELFLPNLELKSKAEILEYMCGFVMEKKGMKEEFYHYVLKREALAGTDFGNKVAMPHPYKTISKDTFVCVGILEEPVLWGEQMIQVIFLVSIAKQKGTDLQRFYQTTTRFLMNDKAIQELIKKRSFKELTRALTLIEKEMEETRYGR